jgi:hypothetical protein
MVVTGRVQSDLVMTTRWKSEWNDRPAGLFFDDPAGSGSGLVDLRRVAGEGGLARVVLDSVKDIEDLPGSNGVVPAAIMLTLLTYGYAAGWYGSDEIEAGVRQDDVLRYLAANHRPRFDELRRFRRLYRSQLRRCLAGVLRRLSDRGLEPVCGASGGGESYLGLSVNRWPEAGYDSRHEVEAERRIGRAVQADSYAMDE